MKVYYNYTKRHGSLKGSTPAESALIKAGCIAKIARKTAFVFTAIILAISRFQSSKIIKNSNGCFLSEGLRNILQDII